VGFATSAVFARQKVFMVEFTLSVAARGAGKSHPVGVLFADAGQTFGRQVLRNFPARFFQSVAVLMDSLNVPYVY
jgi:hypothetical protein